MQKKEQEIEILEVIIQKHKEREEEAQRENEEQRKRVEEIERERDQLRTEKKKLEKVVGMRRDTRGGQFQESEEEADEYAVRKVRQRHAENRALERLAEDYEERLKDKERQIGAMRRKLEEGEHKEEFSQMREKKERTVQTEETRKSLDQRIRDQKQESDRWEQVAQTLANKLEKVASEFRKAMHRLARELELGPQERDTEKSGWAETVMRNFRTKIWDVHFQTESSQVEQCGSASAGWFARVLSEVSQMQRENKEMSGTIAKYTQQIKEVSSRNELINSELDKIMRQIPETQEAQQRQICELKAELRRRDEQKKAAEEALNELKEKVIPSLREMLGKEKQRTKKMDQQMERYADLEQKYRKTQTNERENHRNMLAQKELEIRKLHQSKAPPNVTSLGIRHCASFWRPKRTRKVVCDIEDVTPRLFQKRVKTPASFERIKGRQEKLLKSTEVKCASDLNESLQDIHTVSTNKNRLRTTPISMFTTKDVPVAESTLGPQSGDWASAKKVQEVLEKLVACKDRVAELENEKRKFKQCSRCLIANRHLLAEEKQNLILSSGAKRRRWRNPVTSSDMSKVLFSENLGFKKRFLRDLAKQRMATPLASTKGLNSLSKVTGQDWAPRLRTHENHPVLKPNFSISRQMGCENRMRLEDFMITPRIERGEQLAKQMEICRYFSGKQADKVVLPENLGGAEKDNSVLAGLSDTSNFKSFTTFLSIPKSLKPRETDEPPRGSPQLDQSEGAPKSRKKRKKGSTSKSKKRVTRKVKLKSLGQEQRLTTNEQKMLKKVLKTMRSESKSKKKRAKRSLDVRAKKGATKTGARKKSCLGNLLKRDEMRRMLGRNLARAGN